MRTLLTFVILALALPAFASTYRWVDEDGVVHYSDKPHEGAEQIELTGAQGYTPVPVPQTRSTRSAGDAEAFQYDSVEIVSPYEEEVLFGTEEPLSLQVVTVPALRPNHFLRLTIDGKNVTDKPVRNRSFQVEGVFRGTHSAQLTVVDENGSTIQQSSARTFHVRQNIANAPRPQPRSP
ncbi:MAG: DUF4124 domain-containing protein [Gammaproteobacteria bacterium]|jgi:hypothetical protein|nr:DUF4124 domain-containing protein [Gammaproteobacteria bacterium]